MPKLQATHYRQDEVGESHTNIQNYGTPTLPPPMRCEWAPGNEEHHHPSQRVVEGPPRQAGHTRHLQHHGVSTVL